MATDYEEKYLSLRDENTALKKKKNEQEATIKRYIAVLLRTRHSIGSQDGVLDILLLCFRLHA